MSGGNFRACLSGAVAAITTVAMSACQNAGDLFPSLGTGPNFEAKLQPAGGSTLTGAAIVRAYDGGVMVTMNFNGRGPGGYRAAIHANGNCKSYNGFGAGPPWAPPGVTIVTPIIYKNDDSASLVARFPGYRMEGPDGVVGRSVVIHSGTSGSLEAEPSVPNNRIGCGVIGVPQSLFTE